MKIQTAGELRQFLCSMLVGVKNGDLEISKAAQITKMAEQVTNSLYSEMKLQQLQMNAGKAFYKIGQLPINDNADDIVEAD